MVEHYRWRHLCTRMFLASSYILWPITGMSLLIIQQTTNTNCSVAVPFQHVQYLDSWSHDRKLPYSQSHSVLWGGFLSGLPEADSIVRIVTLANQAEPAAVVDKTVRTGLQESLAFIAVIIGHRKLVGSILERYDPCRRPCQRGSFALPPPR